MSQHNMFDNVFLHSYAGSNVPPHSHFCNCPQWLGQSQRHRRETYGERAFRVLFAGTSLPLAVSTVVSSRSSSYEHKIKFCTANLWPFYPYLIELIDASRAVIQVQFTDHIYCNSGVFYQPQIRWCSVMAVTGCSCVTSIIMAL